MKKLIGICLILLCLCGCVEDWHDVQEQPVSQPKEESTEAHEDDATCGPKGVPYGISFEGKEDYDLFCSLAELTEEEMRRKEEELALSWPFYTKAEYDAFAEDLKVMPIPVVMRTPGRTLHVTYWDPEDYYLYELDYDLGWRVNVEREDTVRAELPEGIEVHTVNAEFRYLYPQPDSKRDWHLYVYINGFAVDIVLFDCPRDKAVKFAEHIQFCTVADLFQE